MKLLTCLALLLPGRTPVPVEPAPISIPLLIHALKVVEDSHGKVGKHGETGDLQWKRATLEQFKGDEYAYVSWLMRACKTMNRKPTPYLCALVHNAGYGTVMAGKQSALQKDFASRVEATYYDQEP